MASVAVLRVRGPHGEHWRCRFLVVVVDRVNNHRRLLRCCGVIQIDQWSAAAAALQNGKSGADIGNISPMSCSGATNVGPAASARAINALL